MAISHNQTVTSYYGFTLGSRTTMDGDKLADHGIVTDDGHGILTLEFKVLGYIAHNCIGMDVAILANACSAMNHSTAIDDCSIANFHIGIDGNKRTYFYVITNLSVRVNDGKLMDIHILIIELLTLFIKY